MQHSPSWIFCAHLRTTFLRTILAMMFQDFLWLVPLGRCVTLALWRKLWRISGKVRTNILLVVNPSPFAVVKIFDSAIYIIKKKHAFLSVCLFVCLSTFLILSYFSKSIIVPKKFLNYVWKILKKVIGRKKMWIR